MKFTSKYFFHFVFVCFSLLLFACETDEAISISLNNIQPIPNHFIPIDYPEDNAYSNSRFELGKAIFYDTRLSRNNTLSCASCHKQQFAFGDSLAFSKGVDQQLSSRNTPSLANIAYAPHLLREGSIATIEQQALVPIQEENEFDFNILEIVDRLKTDELYQQMSNEAYSRPFDYYVLTRALANFQRAIISGNSKYDSFIKQPNLDLFTKAELNGYNLFNSEKTNCSSCHSGHLFTNFEILNNGIYDEYLDVGLNRFTDNDNDIGKFKVPSLRNLSFTAPYMHDGSFKTLVAVVEHYNKGGKLHINQSELIKPLNLNNHEKSDLIAFLNTLNDYNLINNTKYNIK